MLWTQMESFKFVHLFNYKIRYEFCKYFVAKLFCIFVSLSAQYDAFDSMFC